MRATLTLWCLFLTIQQLQWGHTTRIGNTGSFTVIWNSGSVAETVYHENANETIEVLHGNKTKVWFTIAEVPLITVTKGEDTIYQNGGDYVINSKTVDECSKVRLIEMVIVDQTYMSPQVVLNGELLCNKRDRVTIVFQSVIIPETNYEHLLFNFTIHTDDYNKLKLVYGCERNEQFYGLGVQYTHFNLRGHHIPLFISEQGVGRGVEPLTVVLDRLSPGAGGNQFTTYSRAPFYMTNFNRSLLIESLGYIVFHVPLIGNTVSIECNDTSFLGRIIAGKSPLDILESYTSYAGRMKVLPNWIHNGAILGLQGGTKIVMDILHNVNSTMGNLNDVTGVWLQDWTGQRNVTGKKDLPRTALWWNWEVDANHYPNWNEFIGMLLKENIRVTTYINPLVNNVTNRGTPYRHNYYDEGISKGYFILDSKGKPWTGYSDSCLVDLTNPEGYEWFKNMIVENMLATNISGWMCDFGESVPLDAVLKGGQCPHQYHTLYSFMWGKLNAEAIAEAIEKNIITKDQANVVYFMRSGSVFSPKVTPLFWLGDQLVSWDKYDGLGSAIIGLLNSGMVGYSMTHSDIGGYTAIKVPISYLKYIRSKELFMRWCEFAAFTVVYRSHQGTLPDDNWQFYSTTETMKHFFRMSRVFVAWKFYRDMLMKEAATKGWPVVRHMVLVFPSIEEIHLQDLRYQFMIGTELLIAPVHYNGSQAVEVFLPEGITWVHVWSNTTYQGKNEWVNITAPIGCPVVLYPRDSLIGKQFENNLHNTQLLQFCNTYFK